ncbi:hypothetical protein [Modicisalibacter luteus]|uniref:hypothetical protein n=1 Tax=Modicisalibacter luteus TaxID=453962 RepID=UPI0036315577
MPPLAQRLDTPDTSHTKEWLRYYQRVRAATETICAPLHIEDYMVQSMPDVSPRNGTLPMSAGSSKHSSSSRIILPTELSIQRTIIFSILITRPTVRRFHALIAA